MSKETNLNSYNPHQTRFAIDVLESNPITSSRHEGVQTDRAAVMVEEIFQAGLPRHLPRLSYNSRVLDIGAGTGHIGKELAERTGLQPISLDLVDLRTKKNRTGGFVLADGYQLPFQDGSFDLVVMSDVLHFCRDQRSFLKEAHRVTSKEGMLILIEDEIPGVKGWEQEMGNLPVLVATELMNRILNFQLNFNPYFFHSYVGWNNLLVSEKFWPGEIHNTSWGPFNIFNSIYIIAHKNLGNL